MFSQVELRWLGLLLRQSRRLNVSSIGRTGDAGDDVAAGILHDDRDRIFRPRLAAIGGVRLEGVVSGCTQSELNYWIQIEVGCGGEGGMRTTAGC